MKKSGFTLSELLISIAIVAIIAAITAPIFSNLKPDKTKALIVKAHNQIMDINDELLNDPGIYASNGVCLGLECIDMPSYPEYHNVGFLGSAKYPRLLAGKLNCKDQPVVITNGSRTTASFETADGVHWNITYDMSGARHAINIALDVNGSDGPNCNYSSCQNNEKPDQYTFRVNSVDGNVRANDPLTMAYMMNKSNFRDYKSDYNKAKDLSSNDNDWSNNNTNWSNNNTNWSNNNTNWSSNNTNW